MRGAARQRPDILQLIQAMSNLTANPRVPTVESIITVIQRYNFSQTNKHLRIDSRERNAIKHVLSVGPESFVIVRQLLQEHWNAHAVSESGP